MDKHSNRLKVLFLITKSNWGGAQRYVFDLATNLNSDQYEVVVALGGDGELIPKLAEAGIGTINIPGLTRDISIIQELKAMFAIASIIRKERPDVTARKQLQGWRNWYLSRPSTQSTSCDLYRARMGFLMKTDHNYKRMCLKYCTG